LLNISYSNINKLTEIKISGKAEEIKYWVYDKIVKMVNIEDVVKKVDNKTGTNMQEWVYEVNQDIKFGSRLNLEQKDEQMQYIQFIKYFKNSIIKGYFI
jgi:HD superfamily phosphohydrolase